MNITPSLLARKVKIGFNLFFYNYTFLSEDMKMQFKFNFVIFCLSIKEKEEIEECNVKIGYQLEIASFTMYDDDFVGYAGSAHNCHSLVKLRKPHAKGMEWQPNTKRCEGKSDPRGFKESYYNSTQSCIFGSKLCIMLSIRLKEKSP